MSDPGQDYGSIRDLTSEVLRLLWPMLEYRCTLWNSDGLWPVYQRHGLRPFDWFLNQSLVVHL
jgi:hypothetical protein